MALDLASFQAHLPDQSAVVVANDAGDRHAFENSQAWDLHVAVDLRAASNLWQNLHGNVEELAQPFVPRQGLEIHQHRSRCVCDVCAVDARVDSAREVPQDPRVEVAEIAFLEINALLDSAVGLKQPLDFDGAEAAKTERKKVA